MQTQVLKSLGQGLSVTATFETTQIYSCANPLGGRLCFTFVTSSVSSSAYYWHGSIAN